MEYFYPSLRKIDKKGGMEMLFGKNEKKRWHPGLVIAIGTLAAIGGIAVIERGKCIVGGIKDKMMTMMRGGCDSDSECD